MVNKLADPVVNTEAESAVRTEVRAEASISERQADGAEAEETMHDGQEKTLAQEQIHA